MAVDDPLALGSKVRRDWQQYANDSGADSDDIFEEAECILEGEEGLMVFGSTIDALVAVLTNAYVENIARVEISKIQARQMSSLS